MSFASAGTTIVAGAVAERCKIYVYMIYCVTFAFTYSVTSHWVSLVIIFLFHLYLHYLPCVR